MMYTMNTAIYVLTEPYMSFQSSLNGMVFFSKPLENLETRTVWQNYYIVEKYVWYSLYI